MPDGYLIGADLLGRIRRTVDAAEAAPMRLQTGKIPVRLEGEDAATPTLLKLCKTTSKWEYNTLADLEVWHAGTPPSEEKTAPTEEVKDVVNKIANVQEDTFVLIGKAGSGSWYLIEIGRECDHGHHAEWVTENQFDDSVDTAEIEEGSGAQVLMHDAGCLRWMKLQKITVLTNAYISGNSLWFDRREIWTLPDLSSPPEPIQIEGTQCPEVGGSGGE